MDSQRLKAENPANYFTFLKVISSLRKGIYSKSINMRKDELIRKIDQAKTCQIKVGEHHGFRDIWLVVVGDRLFCRQYSFSKKSWRQALLDQSADEMAYLKVDGAVATISGKIPDDLDTIITQVNQAYIMKYVQRLNYYPEIAKQAAFLAKHQNSTVEILLT